MLVESDNFLNFQTFEDRFDERWHFLKNLTSRRRWNILKCSRFIPLVFGTISASLTSVLNLQSQTVEVMPKDGPGSDTQDLTHLDLDLTFGYSW